MCDFVMVLVCVSVLQWPRGDVKFFYIFCFPEIFFIFPLVKTESCLLERKNKKKPLEKRMNIFSLVSYHIAATVRTYWKINCVGHAQFVQYFIDRCQKGFIFFL